ncbi:unnamed protein product [Rotaria socialis]|uniref:Secreted protein n=1 Tax=Rotaria socialis TaxID=392032 RepID=A0A817X6X0_9BILA|nr:unnamed protein product [Rotaria socialis]CAF3364617.1 unnamed protein product [Rotaria socialis]CAF3374406.1 unnamed protein product [Rotaria socialis]CAF3616993.1 unnamed protein product [Rotaria socialis]CAF3658938.1 unnamed protein product [Rotaria socialis]
MNKIILILCFIVGTTQSFNVAGIGSMDSTIAMLCNAITTKPESANMFIDRLEKFLKEHQQQIQERFTNTYAYISQKENQNKLKVGGESCKTFFDNLESPLLTDLQNNQGLLQFMQQMMEHHLKDLISMIQS